MRIGINVLDDLLERMKPFKSMINLSQICREALKIWVDAYERVQGQGSNEMTKAAANMLWQQYASKIVYWELLGHEDGKTYVEKTSLKDLETLYHNFGVLERQGRPPLVDIAPYIQGTKMFYDRWHEHKEWFERQFELDENTDHLQQAKEAYDRGWLFYILRIQELLKERIAADAKAHERSLKEARAKIELPDHLENPKGSD